MGEQQEQAIMGVEDPEGEHVEAALVADASPTEVMEQRVPALVANVDSVDVKTDYDYDMAGELLLKLKEMKTEWLALWDGPIKEAFAKHKALKAREKEQTAVLDDAIRKIGRSMGMYQEKLEDDRKREEEMARAEAQAEAQKEANDYADTMEDQGDTVAAEAARTHVAKVDSVVKVPSFAPKVKGTQKRIEWHFEIVDRDALPREYLMPDEKAIRAHMNSRKEAAKIDGVRFSSSTQVK